MNVITDNSVPLTLNSAQNLAIINSINSNKQSFINSNMLSNILIPYITSNVFENKSNILNTAINTKQNILTASTSLLGDGSAITNLDYNKITLNKPTNFQADWNTTIINKPIIYTQTEVNNLLSAKEQNLTFNAPLTRTTNTIGINLNSYTPFSALIQSNYANYSALNSCNYITNATSGLNNYYDKNVSDARFSQSNFTPSFNQLNSCNYITNATSGLVNYYDKTTSDARFTQSNFTPSFNQLNSCNYITNATSGLVNYYTKTQDDARFSQSNFTPSFNQLNSCNYITNSTSALVNYYDKTTSDGRFSQSNFTPSFTQLNSCNYITNATSGLVNYYTKTQDDSRFTLSNFTPSFNQLNSCNYITSNTTTLITGQLFTTNNTNVAVPSASTGGGIGDRIILRSGASGVYPHSIGNEDANTLYISTPHTLKIYNNGINSLTLNNTGNISYLNQLICPNNKWAIISADGVKRMYFNSTGTTYFQSGNVIGSGWVFRSSNETIDLLTLEDTGNMTIKSSSSGDQFTINNTNSTSLADIKFLNNNSSAGFIGVAGSGVGGTYPNNLFIQANNNIIINSGGFNSSSIPRMIIDSSGNIGIGTTNATQKLDVYGNINSTEYLLKNLNISNIFTTSNVALNTSNNLANYILANSNNVNSSYLKLSGGNMNPNANITTSGNIRARGLVASSNNIYELLIDPPTSTSASSIQTIQQGIGFNQNLTLQAIAGKVAIGSTDPYTLLHMKGSNPILTIMGQGGSGAKSQIDLTSYDNTTNPPTCSLIATDDGNYSSHFEIRQKTQGAITNSQFTSFYISSAGNIGIKTTSPNGLLELYDTTQNKARLILSGKEFYDGAQAIVNGGIAFLCGVNRTGNRQLWIADSLNLAQNTTNGVLRISPFNSGALIDSVATNGTTSLSLALGNNQARTDIFGSLVYISTSLSINLSTPSCKLDVVGAANIHNNNRYAVPNNYMAYGSLTIGGTNANYGGGSGWSASTAGLMMECQDNTEIVVHDSGTRLASLMYYEGGTNNITIGKDKGWGAISSVSINGNLNVPNITLGSGGKINSYDDYHYIHINQPTDTLTIQEYGTISFNIGPSKSQIARINSSGLTITSGSLGGGTNVSKRNLFTFTPTQVLISGVGLRYVYDINLANYITGIGNTHRVFRIHIWTTSGDFGDSIANVESMSYIIYIAEWAGGPKIRIYQLANSSNGSYISVSTYNSIYYNGWNGTGGATQKYCVLENISSY